MIPLRGARIVLQRFGARPVCFHGKLLHCLDDDAAPAGARIRLALYRCDEGDFALEMRYEGAGDGAAGLWWCDAVRGATLTDVAERLECACPAVLEEWHPGIPEGGVAGVSQAALRFEREAARKRAFRHAAGKFLYQGSILAPAWGLDNFAWQ
jgi:hypothetical protein